MAFVTRNHKQNLTYWTRGANDAYGNPSWNNPIQVKCRWEDRNDKAVDFQGNEVITRSVVYVGVDMGIGTYLFEGLSTDLTPPTDALELKGFSKIPSISGKVFERKAIL